MYAQRYADGPRFRPTSLAAALAINGAVIGALLFANPELVPGVKPSRTIIYDVPISKPTPTPTQEPVKAEPPVPQMLHPVAIPTPQVQPINSSGVELTSDPAPSGVGTGAGTIVEPIPPIEILPPPQFIAAREDPRYLSDFQPPYPDFERDAGREDVVKLRVRIGVDGRVKQVELLGGRDSFARSATAHALAKWRFKPATRGGVPEESLRIMTVRFTMIS